MKNQYFGDRNDFFKYDLLIFLTEGLARIKKFSIVWMLTENDGSQDGGKISYAKGAGDRSLFRFLKDSLVEGVRNVTEIDRYFQTAGHGFTYCSYGADQLFLNEDRVAYFSQIPQENLDAAIVFLDPDNGLEVRSATDRNMQPR